jgi:transcriptional regulator with XRE-family HTH domain
MRSQQRYLHLSYNLRRFRQDLGWTQAELAERSQFTQQYLSALERGLQPRAKEDLTVLAGVFGVSEAALIARRRPLVPRRAATPQIQPSECP